MVDMEALEPPPPAVEALALELAFPAPGAKSGVSGAFQEPPTVKRLLSRSWFFVKVDCRWEECRSGVMGASGGGSWVGC